MTGVRAGRSAIFLSRAIADRAGGRGPVRAGEASITARGWFLIGTGIVLLLVGFQLGYPELAVLAAAALSSFFVAVGFVVPRMRLSATRVLAPERVTRGDPSVARLGIRNDNRFRGMTVLATDRCGAERVPVAISGLSRGDETQVEYLIPTHRRGIIDVGPVEIARADPLGLLTATRVYGQRGRVWVHPVVYPVRAVPAGVARSLDGRTGRVPYGHMTFDGLRGYVLGDSLRDVHWRTSARVGELMVRERTDTSVPAIMVVLDDRAVAHTAESFEDACEVAASIALAGVHAGLGVRLRTVSGAEVSSGAGEGRGAGAAGKAEKDAFCDLLAEATPTADGGSLHPMVEALRHTRLADVLVYVTGPGGVAGVRQLATLCGTYPAIVAGLLGDVEVSPAAMPGLVMLAASTGAEFVAAWDGLGAW